MEALHSNDPSPSITSAENAVPVQLHEEPLHEADGRPSLSREEIALRHARYLEELIGRGKDLAIEMFDDAGNREFEETRRIQFVRLADRVTDTTRKLIVSYDRHCQVSG